MPVAVMRPLLNGALCEEWLTTKEGNIFSSGSGEKSSCCALGITESFSWTSYTEIKYFTVGCSDLTDAWNGIILFLTGGRCPILGIRSKKVLKISLATESIKVTMEGGRNEYRARQEQSCCLWDQGVLSVIKKHYLDWLCYWAGHQIM